MKKIVIMKHTHIYIIALLLLGVFTGCDESFLDVEPSEFLSEDQYAEAAENNPDVVAGSMSGIYSLMLNTGTGGSTDDDPDDLDHDDFGQKGYDIYMDLLSSDLALTTNTYNWYQNLTEFTTTLDYTDYKNYKPWRYYYRIIRSANSVISALGGNDVIPEVEENKHIMGQAKTMRAYAYFYLSQIYANEYNPTEEILPIYIDLDQNNQPKSTAQDVFALIVSDLTDAVSLLETFQRSVKNEVNKYVAEGLLAYAYATMGGTENYTQAKNLTNDIITNGGFTLMSADEIYYDQTIEGGDPVGGFNNVNTSGWMWGVDLTLDNLLDLVSWWGQMDLFTYSYQWAGDIKAMDQGLYDLIPADDVRKNQLSNNTESEYYLAGIYKYYNGARTIGGQRDVTDDYCYMRVAEMYLLNAEAAAQSGDETTAKATLKDLLSDRLPDVSYIDGLSGQDLLDEIYLQTRIELWAEGKSYLAMKRFHATTVRGDNHLIYVGEEIPYNDDRLTLMIPQSEILNNPNISN